MAYRRQLAAILLLMLAPFAQAGCSREIKVSVAPFGLLITVDKSDAVGGVFPELMTAIGATEGCTFAWSVVPRARVEVLFASGKSDMLLTANRSAQRDKSGIFVPMVMSRAAAISINPGLAPVRSLAALVDNPELRVAVVRGFAYGSAYDKAVDELQAQKRLVLARDPLEVARMLDARIADVTIMPPTALFGAIKLDGRVSHLLGALRFDEIAEMPWHEGGLYVSNKLNVEDRQLLVRALQLSVKSGAAYQLMRHYYPATILDMSMRPL